MLRKLQYICLVASIGLAGDRIDLFAKQGPFTLTLFLVLAPFLLLLHFLRRSPARTLSLKITAPIRRQLPFLVATTLFLFFALVSVAFSLDPQRSAVAFLGLLLVIVLGYSVSVLVLEEPARQQLILRSVTLAMVVYLIFCILQCIYWLRGDLLAGSWAQSTFAPNALAYGFPRLSGSVVDANRAGFELVMYLVLLDRFVPRSRFTLILQFAIALFVLLTMSKSAILCWAAYYLFSKAFWVRLATRQVLGRIAMLIVVSSLLFVTYREKLNDVIGAWELSSAISERLSIEEGSSGESHKLLIRRGFETWLSSAQTMITGIGVAAAPKVLNDFFGDDKQGNFHCLYITVIAELGFPAFILLLFLFGYPLFSREGAVPCMAAIMVFNIAYQSHMEPLFWTVLALVWSFECKHRGPLAIPSLSSAPTSRFTSTA